MVRVSLVYNAIHPEVLLNGPMDIIAEYDSEETIEALVSALESWGHEVIPIEADEAIAEKLKSAHPDIVYNIAEGLRGESRESHVPAICEMLGIPYTGSGPLTLAMCLDKARTKQILSYYRISTPAFQVFNSTKEKLNPDLRFPLIAKLVHEGSHMGLSKNSIVDDENSLMQQVKYLIETYHQPVLVEEFIMGR